jgi:hypothetical protein
MTTESLSDLRRRFFGGGSSAEYDWLKASYDAGLNAGNLLAVEDVHIVGAGGEPAFQNGWVDLAGYGPFGFWKNPVTKSVHFQGLIQAGVEPAPNSVVFTLPVEYRPALPRLMDCVRNTLATTFVEVQVDGDVVVTSDLAVGGVVYFDGKFVRL